jgi:4-amino-4-deoxy-L-arabinose transferase-like glycosyltransferase
MESEIASRPRALGAPTGNLADAEWLASPAMSSSLVWRQRALLVCVTLLVMLPFIGKPLHIDDPLFVWTAQHIQSEPFNFYGFQVNWFGYSAPMSDMMKNPPLASYYLAAAALLLGFSDVGLHTAQLLPTLAAVLGMYELARRMCARPLLASLVALGTPVFVVCGTTLMCDMPLVALWCWALVFWHRGLLEHREGLLLSGAVCATLAALTKYFGMCLIPLFLLDTIVVRRRLSWSVLWVLLPIAVLFAFERATEWLYGYGLVADAQRYAAKANALEGTPRDLEGVYRTLVFVGGCVVSVVFFAPRLWSRWAITVGSLLAIVLGLIALYRGWADVLQEVTTLQTAAGWQLLAHVIVFLAAGLSVLGLVASDLASPRWRSSLLLAAWMLGTLLFAGFINWTINGRSILPLAPVLGILVARRLDDQEGEPTGRRLLGEIGVWDLPPIVIGLAAAMLVAAGDYAQAVSPQTAAERLASSHRPATRQFTFVGHWGFQYYFEQHGAVPLDSSHMSYELGDVVIVPRWNTNNVLMPTELADTTELVEIEMPLPIATQRKQINAGFYGTSYGRLPWRIGLVPTDQYLIQVVRRPFRLNIQPPSIR